ncbi:MAG: hypothetical protein KJ964_02430 [Verrucomicrobia bacterium]|nr:hypothetical protein [Verrucomicrobiota bacterium]MBU1734034.1 hypothetical protein [Verrucomicrobiota bacterium]MBU1857130.1 hypothetical protein [Verrucomicrobiota bacterium]
MNNPYVQNVASEFIAILILVLAGYVTYRLTGRRQLLAFFHIGNPKRFLVYLSRITVAQGGSLGVNGQSLAFAGPTFSVTEVEIIGPAQRLFNYIVPGVDGLPGFLKSVLISDVAVDFLPSPLNPKDVDSQTPFLTLGSPGYNAVSQKVQTDCAPLAKFEPDNFQVSIYNLGTMKDASIGFLVRSCHPSSGQVSYYAAGPASVGTAGAAIYLIKNWRHLQKKFGNDVPFVVLLRFRSQDPRQYEVVAEKGQ